MSTEPNTSQSKKARYLTFFLGDEQYGIAIERVKEIIAMMKITAVPKTPQFMRGVINLRGSIIPVVDTRLRFAMPSREADMHTAIIIVEIDKINIGFIVDHVEEVASIDESNLSEPPKFGSYIDTDFISAVAQMGENVVMILDVLKLFEADEIVDLEQIQNLIED
ncbi:MAG: chemotaxis protein CheW [Sulfurimonas sp. RIFCSPHIGHO2_12_FULL_36_9]|uniref:chemotaxis protein CheW n=1 Tax=Sulfurimonas sp. RIFCSPLOWO2_12_36_12 TaxID=1802253 RepID=UPI0008B02134|nr:chemotaxis protein CheW [Sulfurimonas sp. RIFCSPLOWO2_12_36_12]OHD98084.1 MAG: chemotaxis protein CheW [Sulfurimonas sp. RIFCSPHIGHO2_12_FULL_36_9]OHD99411.1 MAG: chemotaxis protein CheW [Sulfurimonas sp. RIFCSPLOWO2_02_FULL_36_28]OHE00746.1 MAG: chemotaxis protein CheW [Sulfurimonas sp. RIFCSPLOWO2_12_36_12]OHE03560.1 MAG: chemotaxis protein CheW [Sulfurimonas sp. RIFCSPLOWO2_12_FULL_36_74]